MASIYDFVFRKSYMVDKETMDVYMSYRKVDHKDRKYDDEKYKWKMIYKEGTDKKFGRWLVSEEFKLRRIPTMGEFYGTSEVD